MNPKLTVVTLVLSLGFTWNIYGDDVRLFEYRVTAGWDK
jgi:hypothetical protein